ncbi:MAG: hypothetical protein R3E60_04615 [Alphaproteobacteria bacterium]
MVSVAGPGGVAAAGVATDADVGALLADDTAEAVPTEGSGAPDAAVGAGVEVVDVGGGAPAGKEAFVDGALDVPTEAGTVVIAGGRGIVTGSAAGIGILFCGVDVAVKPFAGIDVVGTDAGAEVAVGAIAGAGVGAGAGIGAALADPGAATVGNGAPDGARGAGAGGATLGIGAKAADGPVGAAGETGADATGAVGVADGEGANEGNPAGAVVALGDAEADLTEEGSPDRLTPTVFNFTLSLEGSITSPLGLSLSRQNIRFSTKLSSCTSPPPDSSCKV